MWDSVMESLWVLVKLEDLLAKERSRNVSMYILERCFIQKNERNELT